MIITYNHHPESPYYLAEEKIPGRNRVIAEGRTRLEALKNCLDLFKTPEETKKCDLLNTPATSLA